MDKARNLFVLFHRLSGLAMMMMMMMMMMRLRMRMRMRMRKIKSNMAVVASLDWIWTFLEDHEGFTTCVHGLKGEGLDHHRFYQDEVDYIDTFEGAGSTLYLFSWGTFFWECSTLRGGGPSAIKWFISPIHQL